MNWKRCALIGCLTAGLLLGPLPLAPSASAETTIAVKTYGSGLTVEGLYLSQGVSLGGTPVLLTVEFLNGDTLSYDQTTTDEHGTYRFDMTLPHDLDSGVLRAIISVQGEQKSATFNYSRSTGDGVISPIDMGPYRFTGELNGGQKQAVLYDTATGVNLSRSGGLATVTLNESKALSAVRSAESGTKYLTISVPANDPSAEVTVPRTVIQEMITRLGSDAHLLIAAEKGSYDLPLDAINPLLMKQVLDSSRGGLSFRIAAVGNAESSAVAQKLQRQKMPDPLVTPVSFAVQAILDSSTVQLLDYGSRFAQMSIDLTGSTLAANRTVSALLQHAQVENLTPTPSKVFRDAVGHGKLVIKRSGNGIYVPIQDARSFSDLQYTSQKDKIQQLANRHIINGRTTTSFAPQGDITRAEFATLMMLSLGLSDKQGTSLFRDVPANQWYTKPVAIGSTLGLISGHDARTFAPHNPITREEIASLMVRCLSYVEQRPYVDTTRILGQVQDRSNISSWAREDIALAISTGILDKNTSFVEPRRSATRAESAEMLYNLLTYLKMI
ncbi:S-layer family protein [Tumebacillus sp. BK434]|uniref:S-layer homology domain-containing protein n=1 Tax=Tumebacillus sp. BK434 TaxID=2512169 RepID=UPI001045FC3C|nr:S-layer homology domain-containing protein [Tumebacillus sp. BK434]TCP55612.1 S-layer family protein [Tumebacillus sp. BK434]